MRKIIALLLALAAAPAFGQTSTIPISQLPPAITPLTGAESFPLVQGGITRRATLAAISASPQAPCAWWKQSGAGANLGVYSACVDVSGVLHFSAVTDDLLTTADFLRVARTAGSPTLLTSLVPIGLAGSASGVVSVKVQAAAGTYNFNLPVTAGTAGQCLVSQGGGSTAMTWGACSGGGGAVTSVTAGAGLSGGTITTTGTIALDLTHANAWTGVQTFADGDLVLSGSSSGSSTVKAPASAGGTATLFPGSDTIVGAAATQTLTNKSISASQLTSQVPMVNGGTAASLVASNGGLVYSNASTLAILAATATANQIPLSGSNAAPAWSTATYPATTTINQLLFSGSANVISGLSTANNGVLVTSAGGVPSIGSTIPTAVQSNITQLGTISAGVWNGSAVPVANGGTGQATAAAARGPSGLNVDEITLQGNASYSILTTDRIVATNAAFTGTRTWTLPPAATVNPGQTVTVLDLAGGVTSVNTLIIARGSADTINGGTSVTINGANGGYYLVSDGISKWNAQPLGNTGVSGVSSIGGQTGAIGTGAGVVMSGSNVAIADNQAGGRLTLTSATPVLTSGVTGATTVLYTPYRGNLVPIWNGSTFTSTIFAELSNVLANSASGNAGPAAAVASSVYDLFVWSNSGTVTLTRGPVWTSTTARGSGAGTTQLSLTSGIYVNAVNITNGPAAGFGTYVGTFATDSGGGTVSYTFGAKAAGGTAANLNVWNEFNRVSVSALVQDNTSSWTYSSSTWRAADNSTGNRVNFIVGLVEDAVFAEYDGLAFNSGGGTPDIGIGLNSTTAFSGATGRGPSAVNANNAAAIWIGQPGLGVNFVSGIEVCEVNASTGTFYGTNGVSAIIQTGLVAQLRM